MIEKTLLTAQEKKCPHCGCLEYTNRCIRPCIFLCKECNQIYLYKRPKPLKLNDKDIAKYPGLEDAQQSIKELMTYFQDMVSTASPTLEFGLSIGFHISSSECCLHLNLDHLDKQKILRLISDGKLYDEIMILYQLAHLPYADFNSMNVDPYGFKIIDRVQIHLHIAFNPLHEHKYIEHEEKIFVHVREWYLNPSQKALKQKDPWNDPHKYLNKGLVWLRQKNRRHQH